MGSLDDISVYKLKRATSDGDIVDEYWVRYKDGNGYWQQEPISRRKDGIIFFDYLHFSVPMKDRIEQELKERDDSD